MRASIIVILLLFACRSSNLRVVPGAGADAGADGGADSAADAPSAAAGDAATDTDPDRPAAPDVGHDLSLVLPIEAAVEQRADLSSDAVDSHPDACVPVPCQVPGGDYCGLIGDGCGLAIDCGPCPRHQTCGGGGVRGQCHHGGDCYPSYQCQHLGYRWCGIVGDGCGRGFDCGACPAGMTCGLEAPGVCGPAAGPFTRPPGLAPPFPPPPLPPSP
jgi:hypothetical protein